MACKELDITSYFRLTPSTATPDTPIPVSAATSEKSPRGFKPVVSVLVSNYRYYSPQVGKWLSRDPIEEYGGINVYNFVNGNPVNKTDKLGLVFIARDGEPIIEITDKFPSLAGTTCSTDGAKKKNLIRIEVLTVKYNPRLGEWFRAGTSHPNIVAEVMNLPSAFLNYEYNLPVPYFMEEHWQRHLLVDQRVKVTRISENLVCRCNKETGRYSWVKAPLDSRDGEWEIEKDVIFELGADSTRITVIKWALPTWTW